MDFIIWIALGALTGYVASVVMKTSKQQSLLMDIVVGIVGSFVGGFIVSLIPGIPNANGLSIYSFIVAVLGAMLVLYLKRRFMDR